MTILNIAAGRKTWSDLDTNQTEASLTIAAGEQVLPFQERRINERK